MGKIHGMQITLIDKQVVSVDPFGSPVVKDVEITVDNVIVSPATTEDVISQMSVTGKKYPIPSVSHKGIITIGRIKKLGSLARDGKRSAYHSRESKT